jgi:hypothetical protein
MCTCALRISSVFIIMFVLSLFFCIVFLVSEPCWLSCCYVLGWFCCDVALRWSKAGEGRLCITAIWC